MFLLKYSCKVLSYFYFRRMMDRTEHWWEVEYSDGELDLSTSTTSGYFTLGLCVLF